MAKYFTVESCDVGTEAYDDKYVRRLEAEVTRLQEEIARAKTDAGASRRALLFRKDIA